MAEAVVKRASDSQEVNHQKRGCIEGSVSRRQTMILRTSSATREQAAQSPLLDAVPSGARSDR